jgi:hypothetical protein
MGSYKIKDFSAFDAATFLVVFSLYLFRAAFWAAHLNWHIFPTRLAKA